MEVDSSAAIPLADLRVECLGMKRIDGEKPLFFPNYLITNPKNNDAYDFRTVISGGLESDQVGACVALYGGPQGTLVVKTLLFGDDTGEVDRIRTVCAKREQLKGCLVSARIAFEAMSREYDEDICPENYTVVLMRYGGQPLSRVDLKDKSLALAVTYAIWRSVDQQSIHGDVLARAPPASVPRARAAAPAACRRAPPWRQRR